MSRCGKYPNGTLIQCLMKWQEFTLVDCTKEFPIGPAEVPKMEGLLGKESYFLGLFGTTGLTGKNLFIQSLPKPGIHGQEPVGSEFMAVRVSRTRTLS